MNERNVYLKSSLLTKDRSDLALNIDNLSNCHFIDIYADNALSTYLRS